MKNTVIKLAALALLMFITTNISAQRRIYHNSGDTIDNIDTIYWTEDWFRSFVFDTTKYKRDITTSLVGGSCEALMRCYTETPIQVIGMASTFYPFGTQTHPSENWPITQTNTQEFMLLYQAYPDTTVLKLKLPISLTDPYRILKVTSPRQNYNCCNTRPSYAPYYRIYEKYIDKPITVTDSFYVGATYYSMRDDDGQLNEDYLNYIFLASGAGEEPVEGCSSCFMPKRLFKAILSKPLQMTYTLYPAGAVFWRQRYAYMLTFPILLIDTTFANPMEEYECPQVSNFRAAMTWESGGTLMWDVHARHRKWQIRICQVGQSYDNYLVDTTVNVPYFTVEGLQSTTHYTAYARAMCIHYDDTLYGDWSNGIDLYTVVDVTAVDQSNEFVQLMPNPANDFVQVMSCFPINKVSLYDLQGRRVDTDIDINGVSAIIDVRKLPRGMYVVLVDNQQGVCTKKVVLK